MKDIFAELGGCEAYLCQSEEINRGMERREVLIARATQESKKFERLARNEVVLPASFSHPAILNPEC